MAVEESICYLVVIQLKADCNDIIGITHNEQSNNLHT